MRLNLLAFIPLSSVICDYMEVYEIRKKKKSVWNLLWLLKGTSSWIHKENGALKVQFQEVLGNECGSEH